jgi:hypothetical protein
MHLGENLIHRIDHQPLKMAAPLYVPEEFLSTEQEMLTHVDMLV